MAHVSPSVSLTLVWTLGAIAGGLSGTGCVTSGDEIEGDAIDDSFIASGKADAAGIPEDSPDALGVLRVANGLDGVYDFPQGLTLDVHAADAIAEYLAGNDGERGTADDNFIDSLVELDAIHWVGQRAFLNLLDYAQRGGYVADYAPLATCGGDTSMSSAAAAGRLGTLSDVTLGNVTFELLTRHCDYSGCARWTADPGEDAFQLETSVASLDVPSSGLHGVVRLHRTASGTQVSVESDASRLTSLSIEDTSSIQVQTAVPTAPALTEMLHLRSTHATSDKFGIQIDLDPNAPAAPLKGSIGAHCVYMQTLVRNADATRERLLVVHGTY